jgi:hypothetical protein
MLRHSSVTGIEEYGDFIAHFLHSPTMMGKKVVLVGHSTGTCAWYVRLHGYLIPHSHFICCLSQYDCSITNHASYFANRQLNPLRASHGPSANNG